MKVYRLRSFEDYQRHSELMHEEYAARKDYENNLLPRWRKTFTVGGYSFPAKRNVKFHVDYMYGGEYGAPNWRERLVCPITGLNNRARAASPF